MGDGVAITLLGGKVAVVATIGPKIPQFSTISQPKFQQTHHYKPHPFQIYQTYSNGTHKILRRLPQSMPQLTSTKSFPYNLPFFTKNSLLNENLD